MVINWFYLLDKVESRKGTKEPQKLFFGFSYRFHSIAPLIPVTIENSTCDISSATIGTLFLCCVRVVNQNTRALLFLCFVIVSQRVF